MSVYLLTPSDALDIEVAHRTELPDDDLRPKLVIIRRGQLIAMGAVVPEAFPEICPLTFLVFGADAVALIVDVWLEMAEDGTTLPGYADEAYAHGDLGRRSAAGDAQVKEAISLTWVTPEGTVQHLAPYVRNDDGTPVWQPRVVKDGRGAQGRLVVDHDDVMTALRTRAEIGLSEAQDDMAAAHALLDMFSDRLSSLMVQLDGDQLVAMIELGDDDE